MIPAAHLNETLKRAMPIVGRNKPAAIAQALQSPYLTFDGRNDEGLDVTAENILKDDWGMTRTPFPLFRFCCDTTKRMIFGLCERREREIALLCFTRERGGQLGDVCWAITFRGEPAGMAYDGRIFDSRTMEDLTSAVTDYDSQRAYTADEIREITDRADPEEMRLHRPALVKERTIVERASRAIRGHSDALNALSELSFKSVPDGAAPDPKDTFMALYGTILLIAYNYLAPHSFMARVTPAKEGKSVEWLRAREHYTVIHRNHAANSATVKEGATVSDHGNLQRLAHSRRAHTKLLKHPRYRFKLGQRIFVRASWVGPKEWQDTAGQTYTIVQPAQTNAAISTAA